jgi:dipeptidyl aminopeptidase/acylaminoacyl peptidase
MSGRHVLPVLLFVVSASPFESAKADAPTREWTPEAMLAVQQLGGVQVAPDGRRVAFVVREAVMTGERSAFVSQIHVADADGGGAFPLTRGEQSSDSPQWSPDGEQIAFLSRRSGKDQVWLIRVRGGESRRLTDAETGVVGFRWSPDGTRIAFTSADPTSPDRRDREQAKDDARVVDEHPRIDRLRVIAVEEPAAGTPRVDTLSPRDFSVAGPFDWSPDGMLIAFAHSPSARADDWRRSDIAIVDVNAARVQPLVHTSAAERAPVFSPDGSQVAYLASDDPPSWGLDSTVHVVARSGGSPRALAATFDRRPELLGWSADGRSLFCREHRGTTARLYRVPIEGEPRAIGPCDGVIAGAALNRARTRIGYIYQTTDKPPEAYVSRLDPFDPTAVSRVNAGTPDRPLGRTEVIRWAAPDGLEIEGLLTHPVVEEPGRRPPLLVVIHGGPAGVFDRGFIASPAATSSSGQPTWSAYPVAAFAARGFAVLRCNVRGSSGYGRAFRFANYGDWGGKDFQDLLAGIDAVVKLGSADADQIGVMGWSYGGYLTAWAITHSTRFQAASAGAAVTDLVSFTGTADIPSFLPDYFGGEPWDRPDIYRAHSPMAHVKGVNIPTLIQHGEADERVPIAQGYELYNALKRQGCPARMVVYPRTHHSIQEPKLLLDAMKRNLDWFETHLNGTTTPGSAHRVLDRSR